MTSTCCQENLCWIKKHDVHVSFTFCRAMICVSAVYAAVRCLSVRLSVRPSRSYILSKEIIIFSNFFHHRIASRPHQFFHNKRHGNTPMGTPPQTGASNAGGVGKNRDSQPISSYRIDDCWRTSNNFDGRPCNLPHRPPSRMSDIYDSSCRATCFDLLIIKLIVCS